MVSSVKDDEGSQVAGGHFLPRSGWERASFPGELVGLVFTWLIRRLSCFKAISKSQHPRASDC